MNEPNKKDSNPRFLIFQNSEAYLRKIISDMPFLIYEIVPKVLKAVLSNFTILSDVKQSDLFGTIKV